MVEINERHFFSDISPLFPDITADGKIETVQFLEATKSFIKIYDILGPAFFVVKNDMSGNVEKLYKVFKKSPERYHYLNDMINEERFDPKLFAVDALLWLQRALEFTLVFMKGLLNYCGPEQNGGDGVDDVATCAYEKTLKRYHGWMLQKLFKVIVKACPSKSGLFKAMYYGKPGSESLLGHSVMAYSLKLESNLQVIIAMYDEWDLCVDYKV